MNLPFVNYSTVPAGGVIIWDGILFEVSSTTTAMRLDNGSLKEDFSAGDQVIYFPNAALVLN